MREHEAFPDNNDRSWTDDLAIGELPLLGETPTVRLRLHIADEPHRGRESLYPLAHQDGPRTYVHARPYVLEPAITLAIDLSPAPNATGVIGEVVEAAWAGMRHREIGNAQAWYYPRDRVLVLWECVLEDWLRHDDPRTDRALGGIWAGFERVLRGRFPAATRIATPSWEDLYERPTWQQFLGDQGYALFSPGCFVKDLAGDYAAAS